MTEWFILIERHPVKARDMILAVRWMHEHWEECIVGRTKVGELLVCTSFLGLNHNHFGGPPLIFETMMRSIDGMDEEGHHAWMNYQERGSTWEEAEAMHAAGVAHAEAFMDEHTPGWREAVDTARSPRPYSPD